LYFDYPGKPNAFPFDKPLSDILFEKYHSQETLFNWNTAGSTVVVKLADMATLATAQTGALPITYGSDLHPGEAVANWASVVL
jgi:hypothetical protein